MCCYSIREGLKKACKKFGYCPKGGGGGQGGLPGADETTRNQAKRPFATSNGLFVQGFWWPIHAITERDG